MFDTTSSPVDELVSAFFDIDPYYPRARPTEPLYDTFVIGYLSQLVGFEGNRGAEFLDALELARAAKDEKKRRGVGVKGASVIDGHTE